MDKLVDALISTIPGLVVAIATGVIVLVIEYRTSWFANHVPSKTITKEDGLSKTKDVPVSGYWTEVILAVVIILIVLLMPALIVYAMTTISHETILDNPDDRSIVVLTAKQGDSTTFFNNDLFVTVTDFNFYTSPLTSTVHTNTVNFVIASPGYDDKVVENATIGSSLIYETAQSYYIRVTSMSTRFTFDEVNLPIVKMDEGAIPVLTLIP